MTDEELANIARAAMDYHSKGDYLHELELWQTAARERPANPMWQHNVALALMNNERFAEALELFDDLAEHHPELSRVHNNRAILLLRLGFENKYLAPAYSVALATSRDADEFYRHLHNLCISIAFGSDIAMGTAFDALENTLSELAQSENADPSVSRNIALYRGLISAFRNIAAFRQAFARKAWKTAEEELETARQKLVDIGLNRYEGIIRYSARCLALCRETIGALEEVTQNPDSSPQRMLERFKPLLSEALTLWQQNNQSALNQLVNILGCFLSGCENVLRCFVKPESGYHSDDARVQVVRLSSDYFVDIGRDLSAFLDFADRQCVKLVETITSIASQEVIRVRATEAWTRLVLFTHGLTFNFQNVDAALANQVLGWRTAPVDEARLEIQKFKLFVERQAHKDVFVGGHAQENIARALLQAFLTTRSYREVKVRGGFSDLLAFSNNGRFLYETKIWRGPEYYAQGLRELEEYIAGEKDDGELKGAFYIVFDPTKSQSAGDFLRGSTVRIIMDTVQVDVVVVNLCPPPPSKKSSASGGSTL